MRPPILYKYRSLEPTEREHTLRAITHREICFSSVSAFNDPFEARVLVQMEGNEEAWRRKFQTGAPSVETLHRMLPKLEAGVREDAEKLGLFCLSTKRDDILMWAHYAGCHRGLCFGFRTTPMNSVLSDAQPVEYSEGYPLIDYFNSSEDQRGRAILLRKAEHWRYEDEWRAFRAEMGPGIVQYPSGMLAEVILGAQIKAADRNQVLRAASALPHPVDVFQAQRAERAYALELMRIA